MKTDSEKNVSPKNDGEYKYILRLMGEFQDPDNKRDIAEYESPEEAVEAGLFYINEANEFMGDVSSNWMLLKSNLKKGQFVAKRDMPDPAPCIYLISVKSRKNKGMIENKEAMIKALSLLVKVSNSLDEKGFTEQADALDEIINDIGDFSDLDSTNITKDEAFIAGHAVATNECEAKEGD